MTVVVSRHSASTMKACCKKAHLLLLVFTVFYKTAGFSFEQHSCLIFQSALYDVHLVHETAMNLWYT